MTTPLDLEPLIISVLFLMYAPLDTEAQYGVVWHNRASEADPGVLLWALKPTDPAAWRAAHEAYAAQRSKLGPAHPHAPYSSPDLKAVYLHTTDAAVWDACTWSRLPTKGEGPFGGSVRTPWHSGDQGTLPGFLPGWPASGAWAVRP